LNLDNESKLCFLSGEIVDSAAETLEKLNSSMILAQKFFKGE